MVSHGDSIVVATTGGVRVVSIDDLEVIRDISVDDGVRFPYIKKITVSKKDGSIWFISNDNLFYISYKDNTLKYPTFFLNFEKGYDVESSGDTIFLLSEKGIFYIEERGKPMDFYQHNISILENRTSKTWKDIELGSSLIYVMGDDGIHIFDRSFKEIKELKIKDILFIKEIEESLYVGFNNKISILKDTLEDFIQLPDSILRPADIEKVGDDFYIPCVMPDLYVRLHIYDGESLHVKDLYFDPSHRIVDIRHLCRDKRGNLWLGCERENHDFYASGIMRYSVERGEVKKVEEDFIPSNGVISACSDRIGNLYFLHGHLGFQKGLSMLEKGRWYIFSYYNSPIYGRAPQTCAVDGKGRVIFGCWTASDGVARFNPYTYEWDYKIWEEDEKTRNIVSGVAVDQEDRVWAVNYIPNEVTVLSSDSLKEILRLSLPLYPVFKLKFFNNRIFGISTEGLIIISTENLMTQEIKTLSVSDGLPSIPVKDVEKDIFNHYWVATESGIGIFDSTFTLIKIITTDNSPLKSDDIIGIETDWEERLWILSKDSLFIYDPFSEQWTSVDSIISSKANYNDLFIDKKNRIVILSTNYGATVIKDVSSQGSQRGPVIFPNPVREIEGVVRIGVKDTKPGDMIYLVNMKGNIEFEKRCENYREFFTLYGAEPGIYILILKRGEQLYRKPFIVIK